MIFYESRSALSLLPKQTSQNRQQTNETNKNVSCFNALSPIVWQPCVWMTAPLQCPHYWQAVLKKVLCEAELSLHPSRFSRQGEGSPDCEISCFVRLT